MSLFNQPKTAASRTFNAPRRRALSLAAGLVLAQAMPHSRAQTPTAQPIRLALIEGLSGPFGNAGLAVWRNLQWAAERINQRGGVRLPEGARPLEIVQHDSKGQAEEALAQLRLATDRGTGFVVQGNSSAVASVLVDALNKHNEREPARRALLLNVSAVDPVLTNERCSPWHFRFDAHADMRLAALMSVLQEDKALKQVYLIGQDYSFGQHALRQARALIEARRPDIQVVGDELHPLGRVKDFMPYATKIRASGAQAVFTPNWGNDLSLLVKACHELGLTTRFYTFYGNALGTPAAIGDAGIGRVLAVAEWFPNGGTPGADALVQGFRQRFPDPADDYLHVRMQAMVHLLVQAIEKARSADPQRVAQALEGLSLDTEALGPLRRFHGLSVRAQDHQAQQPLAVAVMDRAGQPGVPYDVEGSGFGFRVVRRFDAAQLSQPSACRMLRPWKPI